MKSFAATLSLPAFAQAAPTIKLAMIEGLSGGNANGGEAVFRKLVWAVERVNALGGVRTAQGIRQLELVRYDSKGQIEEALAALRSAVDDGAQFIRTTASGRLYSARGKRQLAATRPDVEVTGDELHPLLRIKDFAPYATKIKTSGAQTVVTGNFSTDLTLLVKAAREVGFEGKFYTFYGNALGAPAAMGEAGIGRVIAVADWLPNVPPAQSESFYKSFRQRYPNPADDYVHMRMQLLVVALAQAIEKAGSMQAAAVAASMRAMKTWRSHGGRTSRPSPAS